MITGFYEDANFVSHSFLRDEKGAFSTFDAAGAGTTGGRGTFPSSINRDGAITRVNGRGGLTGGRRSKLISEKCRIPLKQLSSFEELPGPRGTPDSAEIWSIFDAG